MDESKHWQPERIYENRVSGDWWGRKAISCIWMPILTVNNPNSELCIDLYAEQSIKSEFLGVYFNGTQVTLMGFNGTWAHVIVDGKVGFMLAKYLE